MKSKDINIDNLDWKNFSPIIPKENIDIRIDKQNNSKKIICFNVLFGIAVSLLQMITEVTNYKIKDYEWLTNSLSFLISFLLIIVKTKELKMRMHYIIVTFCSLLGLFLKLYTSRCIMDIRDSSNENKEIINTTSVYTYINLSCCLIVFIASLCFDRKRKFKWMHFLSSIFFLISFALYFYFNIVINIFIEITTSNQKWFIFASIILLSITPLYQQIFFLSGSNIYHYLGFQGLAGFAFFLGVSWFDREWSNLVNIHLAHFKLFAILPYGIYALSMVTFILVYPFYLKKAHCVMSTMFLGWKYLFIRKSNWVLCIGENALFFIGAVCFNIKKILKRDSKDLMNNSIEIIENFNQNKFSMSDGSFLKPLMNESFSDDCDISFDKDFSNDIADHQLAFYKQKKMTSVNKYL